MKTTIDIPDDLARQAKDVAREGRVTLRDLVVAGLRSEIDRRRSVPRVDLVFPTVGGVGLVAGVAPTEAVAASYDLPA